jgi:hypothetical protein
LANGYQTLRKDTLAEHQLLQVCRETLESRLIKQHEIANENSENGEKDDKNVGYTRTYTELRNGAAFVNCKIGGHQCMKSGNNCIYFAFQNYYFSRNIIHLLQDQLMSLCSKLHLYITLKVQM